MPGGPPPTPAAIRLLKGNGKDRDVAGRKVARQPMAVPAVPPMPDELGEHGERIWRLVTPELSRLGILGVIDLGTLEMYCRLYQAIYDHRGRRTGFVPLVTTFANLGSKLGLDPASRLRMTLPEATDGEDDRILGTG